MADTGTQPESVEAEASTMCTFRLELDPQTGVLHAQQIHVLILEDEHIEKSSDPSSGCPADEAVHVHVPRGADNLADEVNQATTDTDITRSCEQNIVDCTDPNETQALHSDVEDNGPVPMLLYKIEPKSQKPMCEIPLCPEINIIKCTEGQSGSAVSAESGKLVVHEKYGCDLCPYVGHQIGDLLAHHKKSHVNPYKCSSCPFTSGIKGNVIYHERTAHASVKPVRCLICPYETTSEKNLAVHERNNHMGRRPYKCSQCSYRSAQAKHLRVHQKAQHVGDSIYRCPLCPYTTSWRGEYSIHETLRHKEKPHLT